ncbi:MAG: SGNH/GDSL hydrolase family protein [Caldilineaceae bacterium]|nr:SGNH/GDSL hydrolase family protein [Caldilineaceae bacterium]HRJ43447.1 SGNH/GDSL hydrolase family protein [Caldilineaceae bacterium]
MDKPRLYVIGDSISLQYGPYLEQYLAGRYAYARKTAEAEARLNLPNPQGDNGGDSSAVRAFLAGLVEGGDWSADLLLVNCGLHDIKTDPITGRKQVEIDDYRANLEGIVALARQIGVPLVWVRTTPCDEAVHNARPGMAFHRFAGDCVAYNAVADGVMAAAGVPSIDLHSFTASLGSDLYCDHVHFHEAIREKQAAYMAGWLEGYGVMGRA